MGATREEIRQSTQRRVVEAAGRLMRERGFAATTIRDIAEDCGVSVGTVMAAGDKNSLLVQVFDALIEAEHLRRDGPGSEKFCPARVMGLVQPFVTMFTDHRDLSRSYASILVSGDHTSTVFSNLADRLIDEMGAAIAQHGCTPREHVAAKAAALYFAYIGTLFTWSAGGGAQPAELTEALRISFAAICDCREEPT